MKILVFGSNGLVGSSIKNVFSKYYDKDLLFFSTRDDTNLFDFKETKKTIEEFRPDILINAAARVGGIFDNNTNRTSFFLDNMKININVLESCITNNKIKIINLGSSCIYPLNAKNPINENSIFPIWSMSKPITIVAMMILKEREMIDFKDNVSKYLPEFKNLK